VEEGVFAGLLGPSFETRAEAAMLKTMGVSYVGMSLANEVIMAQALGMNVLGLTLATNESGAAAVTHEKVKSAASAYNEDFERLVRGILHLL
jgi:purine-nucleoside phosphorylase